MTIEELLASLSDAERFGAKPPQIELPSRKKRRSTRGGGAPIKSFEDFAAAVVVDSILEDPEIPLPPGIGG